MKQRVNFDVFEAVCCLIVYVLSSLWIYVLFSSRTGNDCSYLHGQ